MPSRKKPAEKKTGARKPDLKERAEIVGAPRVAPGGSDLYTPPLDVLIKLGSLAVHVEELIEVFGGYEPFLRGLYASASGRNWQAVLFDLNAIRPLLEDEAVQKWRASLGALLPVKRSAR